MKKLSGKYVTIPLVRRVMGMPGHEASSFNGCISMELTGKRTGSRGAQRMAFKEAAQKCHGTRNPGKRRGISY